MGAIENEKVYGLTLRESADDGSDFGNPDADYRRLFLGEDGQLHVKDSAGSVTGIGGAIADILDLETAEDDDSLVLAPDGEGGVEFRAEAGGLVTGTSFPGSPSTGDRYRRSDLDYLVFFHDGTRWLSEQMFTVAGSIYPSAALTATAAAAWRFPLPADLDTFLVKWDVFIRKNESGGAGNWTLELNVEDFDDGVTQLDSVSSSGLTDVKWYHYTRDLDDVIDSNAGNSTASPTHLTVDMEETSGNATFFAGFTLYYRYIAA